MKPSMIKLVMWLIGLGSWNPDIHTKINESVNKIFHIAGAKFMYCKTCCYHTC